MDDDAAPDLRQYLTILRRRKGLVVLVAFVITAVTVGLSARQSPTYQASAQVLLEAQSVDPVADGANNGPTAERQLNNEVRQLESTKVREAVAEVYKGPLEVSMVKGAVDANDADVISVSVSGRDPEEVSRLVNTYVDTYLKFRPQQQVAALLETGNAVRVKVDELRKRVTEVSAPLVDLDARIAAATPAGVSVRNPLTTVSPAQVAQLAQVADLQRQRNVKFEELNPQLTSLQSQLAFYQDQLDKVLLSAGIRQAGELRLLAPATVPSSPVSPKPLRNGVLGLMIGALLGVGLALARDHLDDTLRDRATLETESKLPTLGVIPRFRTRRREPSSEVVTLSQHTSPAAEAFRTLRTSVKFLRVEDGCCVLQITSANAGEGKTLTAMNLAVALAQAGDRTIVVGCDLRRPRLDELAHTPSGPGLTSILVGDAKLHEAVERHENLDLAILRTGPIPPDPSELLSGKGTAALIQALRSAYEVVILDCPPLLPVTDALILAAYCDATLLVVSEGTTSRRGLVRALELLRQVNAPLRGTVLNGSKGAAEYGYGRYAYAAGRRDPSGGRSKRALKTRGGPPATPADGVLVER